MTIGTELLLELCSSTLDTLFRRARDELKIEDLHFHVRAESLTRWIKKVDIMALAKISGHKDINELMTCYRETASQIAEGMGLFGGACGQPSKGRPSNRARFNTDDLDDGARGRNRTGTDFSGGF